MVGRHLPVGATRWVALAGLALKVHDEENAILRRRSLRLKDYDYSQDGAYFVTICTHNRQCLFGEIIDNEVRINDFGRLVESEWLQTSKVRSSVILDAYMVMPNHFHAIFFLDNQERATQRGAPTKESPTGPVPTSVGAIIGQFKSQVTKKLMSSMRIPIRPLWQRNYYEHVIRDEDDLNRIREYIQNNSIRWMEDEYYAP